MININNITKIYKTNICDFFANKNISLNIEKGSIVGFLGPNGAGKTTLIKIICNLITPTSGAIYIDNMNIKDNPDLIYKNVGVVLEGARNLYNFLTVNDNLNYFSYLNRIDKKHIEENKNHLLKLFDLTDKKHELVSTLSRGMQQKVAIIVAILKDPDILILDEPTLGLDIVSKLKMKELLKNLSKNSGKTLIISSHDLDVINDVCEKVAIFNKGLLVEYDYITKLKFNNTNPNYNIILQNNPSVLNLLKKLSIQIDIKGEDFIEFKSNNIDQIISGIDSKYLYSLEKESNDIKDILIKAGEKFDNI